MGTNYYHRYNECEHCGRYDQEHIGKSSAGWQFSFHGRKKKYDDDPPSITSWREWQRILQAGGRIFDEYEEEHSFADFAERVEKKRTQPQNHTEYLRVHYPQFSDKCWLDDEGYSFDEGEFS